MEHRVRYRHNRGEAEIDAWLPDSPDPEAGTAVEPGQATAAPAATPAASWQDVEEVKINPIITENKLILHLPYELLDDDGQFCWLADAANQTKIFASRLPDDELPDEDSLVVGHIQLFSPPVEPAPAQ
jgi:hypothetical protein